MQEHELSPEAAQDMQAIKEIVTDQQKALPDGLSWRTRVQHEFEDLAAKLARLTSVLEAKERGELPVIDPTQHALLIAQHAAMTSYHTILFLRLNVETR